MRTCFALESLVQFYVGEQEVLRDIILCRSRQGRGERVVWFKSNSQIQNLISSPRACVDFHIDREYKLMYKCTCLTKKVDHALEVER
jgi:hypothetical protein